ncbi:RnfABCDGE type electron transport complex subunit G [bacterium]|nr:RnfABCDGE type electron transport complex subunit G [bacterium]RQV95991.1 MAG: RnfABCDGE type electron transport complex subunit G [bacterium]
MKDIIRFSLILTFVAIISAGSLSWINKITKSEILSQEQKNLTDALMEVLPGSNSQDIIPIQQEGQILYYIGYVNSMRARVNGYALIVESKGYTSTIRTLVGIDTSGTILRIKILFQEETPGLGSRCEEIRNGELIPWWQAQFQNMNINNLAVDKDGGLIQSITGATITSRAITDSIANKTKVFIETMNSAKTDKIDE